MRSRHAATHPNLSAPLDHPNGVPCIPLDAEAAQESTSGAAIPRAASHLAAAEEDGHVRDSSPPIARRQWHREKAALSLLVFVFNFLFVVYSGLTAGGRNNDDHTPQRNVHAPALAPALCTITPPPPLASNSSEIRPFWFPSYPFSLDKALAEKIIASVTGRPPSAADSLQILVLPPRASIRPHEFSKWYQHDAIYAIRNPITAFPIELNSKAILYHGHKEGQQVEQEEWREFRDKWTNDLMQAWKDHIRKWKQYGVGKYIQFEHVMDMRLGPLALQKVAGRLREAGFSVASDFDIPCIWYKYIGWETEQHPLKHWEQWYEYGDYVPGYTQSQRDYLLREMIAFVDENKDDSELAAILQDYIARIRYHTVIDEAPEAPRNIPSNDSLANYSLANYKDCATSFSKPAPAKEPFSSKPFWFPSFPDSFDGDFVKKLVTHVTSFQAGAKSFYAKSQKLAKCAGSSETVVCMLIHPIIKANTKKLVSSFQQDVIFAIRNPITAIPKHHNGKAILYHKHPVGKQVSHEEWRTFRDEYLETSMETWKDQIRDWKSMNPYRIGMYFRFEHIMDARFGPLALQGLVRHLREAGFSTASDEEIPCIWFRSVGEEALEQYLKNGYEYGDYVPSYTEAQRDYLLREMSAFLGENQGDSELVAILKDYTAFIRDHLVIDQASANQTELS